MHINSLNHLNWHSVTFTTSTNLKKIFTYSRDKASTGFNLAAATAGMKPKATPIMDEVKTAATIDIYKEKDNGIDGIIIESI